MKQTANDGSGFFLFFIANTTKSNKSVPTKGFDIESTLFDDNWHEVILKLQLAQLGETKLFTGYGEDYLLINRERFNHSVVVWATEVREDWRVDDFAALTEADFDYFLALQPDVLVLGTGGKQHFAHPCLYRHLTNAGIAVECMDTAAACRTYNILVAEDRKVVAAILLSPL